MKTSLPVLGIQATQTLNQIKVTWEAVVRKGKAPVRVQIIEYRETGAQDESGMTEDPAKEEQALGLFAVQEPVLREERLEKEIPRPIWVEKESQMRNGMETGEGDQRSGGAAAGRRSIRLMRVQRIPQKEFRWRAACSFFRKADGIVQHKRYQCSSLSPPAV